MKPKCYLYCHCCGRLRGFSCYSLAESCLILFATPSNITCSVSLSFTISWILLRLKSIESVMPSNHLNLYRRLLLLPSIFPSIRVFSDESGLPIRWPKDWRFSFSSSPCSEYPGLISFRMHCFCLVTMKYWALSISSATRFQPTLVWTRLPSMTTPLRHTTHQNREGCLLPLGCWLPGQRGKDGSWLKHVPKDSDKSVCLSGKREGSRQ